MLGCYDATFRDDFFRRTRRDPLTNCLVWLGGRTASQTPTVQTPGPRPSQRDGGRAPRPAHHVAWELAHGAPVPPYHVLRRRCGTRLCVEVTHFDPPAPLPERQRVIPARIPDAVRDAILAEPLTENVRVVAARHGVSKSFVALLRQRARQRARRQVQQLA